MKNIILIICGIIALSSCNNMPIDDIDPILPEPATACGEENPESNIVINWCNPTPDRLGSGCLPLIYNNMLIFNASIENPGENQKVYFYDKGNGELLRTLDILEEKRTIYHMGLWNDYLVITYLAGGIDVINLDNFEFLWQYHNVPNEENRQKFIIVDDELFMVISHGNKPYIDASSIVAFDMYTGTRRDIVKIHKEDLEGGAPHIHSVQLETNNQGDDVYYFAISLIWPTGPDYQPSYSTFWAYNETQGQYQWQQGVVDTVLLQNDPAIIFENSISVIGENVYTFDKNTGESINSTPQIGNQGHTAPLLVNDRIYAKSAQETLYCFDARDGSIIWENLETWGLSQNKLTHYKGKLYYSGFDNKLYVVDMATGEILYEEKSPFKWGNFRLGGQVIDPATDLMYMLDELNVMSIELLE